MAVEILSGPVTGPYWADDGDIIVVSDDAVVRSDQFNSGAIDNRSVADAGIAILVDGKIRNTGDYGDGIRLDGQSPGDIGDNLVHVRDGGVVRGFNGINVIFAQDSTIVVSGLVRGAFSGINAESSNLSVIVTGSVIGNNSAVALSYGDRGSILNEGQLTGASAGVVLYQSDSTEITNNGSVRADAQGIFASASADLTVFNRGDITATNGAGSEGIGLSQSNGFLLKNEGSIKADTALALSDSTGTIINSGKILGQTFAILAAGHGFEPGALVTIFNTGTISGAYSLRVDSGPVHVTNTGKMLGDIDTTSGAQTTLINGGKIAGAVKLSNLDDSYRAIDDGFVTRFVFAGDGADKLTGGSREDDLRGGNGDDTLIGKGGADRLKGGKGDDILKGGAYGDDLNGGAGRDLLNGGKGNDTLTGGKGADVFVFGADSGTDTVTDFGDGKDTLRLAAHSGGFEALSIADSGTDLRIIHDGGVILLTGAAGSVLTAADFEFV